MSNLSTELVLIILASIVVVSYLFSILSNYIRIPSVLLLLIAGMLLRVISDAEGWHINFPAQLIELFGATGLIMIVLEAGLDLKVGRDKLLLIRSSFLAALFIFILSPSLFPLTITFTTRLIFAFSFLFIRLSFLIFFVLLFIIAFILWLIQNWFI